MAKPRNDLVDRFQYLGLRLVAMMLFCWPVDPMLRWASKLGDLLYRFDRRHRERALANLRRSFPDMPEAHRRDIARRSMQQVIMLFVDVMFTGRLVRLDTFRKYVHLKDISETVGLLLRRDQGLILLTGHYGNFEILGYVLAMLGFPSFSVARPLDNKYISDWLFGLRQKLGQRLIIKKGATEEVVEALDHCEPVGFVADQNAGSKGIFVDFFGRKASTYKSIGLVAMQYNVPVAVGCARRLNNRFEFEITVPEIIYPADWKDQPDPLRYITQRYTTAIEKFVRADPGQYWWLHRRWKSRPKGETPEAYD